MAQRGDSGHSNPPKAVGGRRPLHPVLPREAGGTKSMCCDLATVQKGGMSRAKRPCAMTELLY